MKLFHVGRSVRVIALTALVAAPAMVLVGASPAAAAPITNETDLRTAFLDLNVTQIDLANDIALTNCTPSGGALHRTASSGLTVDGHGFKITQTCANKRVIFDEAVSPLTLKNLTITGGGGTALGNSDGGGVFANGTLNIINSVITDNHTREESSGDGGGAFSATDVVVTNSTIKNNTASGDGGGVFATGAAMVTGSSFLSNTAEGQEADGNGGGLVAHSTMTVSTSTFDANNAKAGEGGGIFLDNGVNNTAAATKAASVVASTFSNNHAEKEGAAINNDANSVLLNITNSTITKNAGVNGGAVASDKMGLVYDTIVDNTLVAPLGTDSVKRVQAEATESEAENAGVTAAAEEKESSNLDVQTLSVFATVIAKAGNGLNCETFGTVTSNGYNFSDDASCKFLGTGDTQNGGDPGLGALANNGGPTLTMLPQTGSPLIDKVPLASCQADGAAGVTTDQRGIVRPQGKGCETGAVEIPVAAAIVVTPKFTG